MWQWYNFCAARIPPGNAPLHINVDETSVCLFQEREKGAIVFLKRKNTCVCLVHLEGQSTCIFLRLFVGGR